MEDYIKIDIKEKITIPDCFVLGSNKIGTGNGEAKMYLGNQSEENTNFFGEAGFELDCFLLKEDLIKYLEEVKIEYYSPEQNYINTPKEDFKELYKNRMDFVLSLPEKISFKLFHQSTLEGPRIYVNSKDKNYKILRELSLPNITYVAIQKLEKNDKYLYYFRLFADFFGEIVHPNELKDFAKQIEKIENPEEKRKYSSARIGQGKYREDLLKLCPFCPITLVSDDRLLIASHIKPWAKATSEEKLDSKNGFMFTPNIDKLFDRGYITFTNDKILKTSPWISKMTYSRLNIKPDTKYSNLPIEGREEYLKYHRNNIFKS